MSMVSTTSTASTALGVSFEKYTVGDVLICKAHRGKLLEVKTLLDDYDADVNFQNQDGCTALHGAAASGQLAVVQFLLHYPGVDTHIVDDEDQTALHYAAFYGHLEVVQVLVEQGVPLDMPDKYGRMAHCSASINGHLDVITYLLEECESPIDINAIDEYGSTCLHWAASKGRKEVLQYLCMKGIDVHVTSYDNKSAYQLAKDKQKGKCVEFLKNWYEKTQTFVHAAEEGQEDVLRRIIAEVNGAFPLRFMRDKNGKNAMHWAAEKGHLSTLKLLGEHFKVWTDADKFGRNALHCAALGGHKECALWLIRSADEPSDFLSPTLTDKTPSRCAFEAGHSQLAARLQAWEEGNDEIAKSDADTLTWQEPPVIEEPSSPTPQPRSREFEIVRTWLKAFDMDKYAKNFEKDGFDTLRGVATIDEGDLIDMRVKKGHRRVVLSHIEELKQQLALLDESCTNAGRDLEPIPTLEMLAQLPKPLPALHNDSSARSDRAASGGGYATDGSVNWET